MGAMGDPDLGIRLSIKRRSVDVNVLMTRVEINVSNRGRVSRNHVDILSAHGPKPIMASSLPGIPTMLSLN